MSSDQAVDGLSVATCPHLDESEDLRTTVRVEPSGGHGDVFRLTRAPFMTLWRRSDRRLPGPVGLPVAGVARQFMRDPFGYIPECQRQYGDIFRLPIPLWDAVVIAHPDLVVEVLHDRGERFGLPHMPQAIARRTGTPIIFLDGERYAERRSIISPMFGKRYLAGIADQMVDTFADRLREWDHFAETGQVVQLDHELAKVTMAGFMQAMFSMSITDEQFDRYDRDLGNWLEIGPSFLSLRPPTNLLPVPGPQNALLSVRRMFREIEKILDHRLADSKDHHDLLQRLVDAKLRDGSPMPRTDVLQDTTALMAAGYDTVVAALTWTLALLPTNPDAQQKLYDEVDALDGDLPTASDLDRLPWATACFDEAQRLQGGPGNFRFAKADTELAGFRIRKGTLIIASMTALHRDPRWWNDPERFDPTRFTDPEAIAARPKGAFIPFGTGPHQCPGMAMGYMNAQLLLALILRRYRVDPLPGWQPRHKATGTVSIDGGFPCTLSRR